MNPYKNLSFKVGDRVLYWRPGHGEIEAEVVETPRERPRLCRIQCEDGLHVTVIKAALRSAEAKAEED